MADDKPLQEGDRPVDVVKFAAFVRYTPTYIRQLQRDGVLPKGSRGEIPFLAGISALIQFLRAEERRSSKSAADTRVRDARARVYELQAAERERRLIEFSEALEFVDRIVGMFRAELSGLPARVTRDLTLRRTIEQALNELLDRLAGIVAEMERPSATGDATAVPVEGTDA